MAQFIQLYYNKRQGDIRWKNNRRIKIVVDCIPNDPVDIRYEEPQILGYDYFIKQEEASNLIGIISSTLEELELPAMNIRGKQRKIKTN